MRASSPAGGRDGQRAAPALASGIVLAPQLLLGALALAPAPAGPPDPRAPRLREEALALAALDDEAGLLRAAGLLDEAARLEPGSPQGWADLAMVELLAAAARRDEATRLEDGEALMQSGRDLRERALQQLRPLVRESPGDLAVVRALAVYYGLDGDEAQAARLAAQARAAGAADPWIDFAEMAGQLGAMGRSGSVPALEAFSASHPGLVRARLMLARALRDAGRTEEALAALEEILARSPDHERAKRLKADILSPPPARMDVRPAPDDAPPPRPPGLLPRKPSGPGRR